MAQKTHSIDGFVPRRTGRALGSQASSSVSNPSIGAPRPRMAIGGTEAHVPIAKRAESQGRVSRDDISQTLHGLDMPAHLEGKKNVRDRSLGSSTKKRRFTKKRIILAILVVLVLSGLAIGGWMLYRTYNAGSNVFKGNFILGLLQDKELKQDANGRSNILVLGTSDDDPGHQASYLTDSIMIVSIDQKNKNAYMVSIPRDLNVEYGQPCMSGYRGKINVYYGCVGGGTPDVAANRSALTKTAEFIGKEVVGMDIQYGVNLNYTVMRKVVDAVGGIAITIESRDPRGQMDSNFDWKCRGGNAYASRATMIKNCPPSGHFIDYPNGVVTLDAEHALYLAQARGDAAPTYGFEQSNFDREKNQQKIAKAIREKALSVGVLTNFSKVSAIIDGIGDNLRTTFDSSEIRTLVSLSKDIKDSDIQSISLIDGDNPVMNGNAQPSAGEYEFSVLQDYLRVKLSSNPVTREQAQVAVYNGSGVVGVAQTQADKLKAAGFIIDAVASAPAGTYANVEIYQVGTGMAATKAKLEAVYGVKVKATAVPFVASSTAHFVVVLGKDPAQKN